MFIVQHGKPALHLVPAVVHVLVALHALSGDCAYIGGANRRKREGCIMICLSLAALVYVCTLAYARCGSQVLLL